MDDPAGRSKFVPSAATTADVPTDALFSLHRREIWGLCYRLTGSAADADELVQETFLRVVEKAPRQISPSSIRHWLVRVATNLAIDILRRRRRCVYVGSWLPSPVETGGSVVAGSIDAPATTGDPAPGYELAQSASYAFLVALEALTPRQRAVLLLRDVLDYSGRETAEILNSTEANVRVIHHRARRILRSYELEKFVPSAALQARTLQALEKFMACLASQDHAAMTRLLANSVSTVTDSAGEYTALRRPLHGITAVARLYLVAARHRQESGAALHIRSLNHVPAIVIDLATPVRGQAPRTIVRCELTDDNRIAALQTVLAPRKLTAIRAPTESTGRL